MYNYEEEKKYVFTDKGQRHFLQIRDHVNMMLKVSGAFKLHNALILGSLGAATNFEMMACVHRLKEIGEIKEIAPDIFVKIDN